jgi:hypothetical protein
VFGELKKDLWRNYFKVLFRRELRKLTDVRCPGLHSDLARPEHRPHASPLGELGQGIVPCAAPCHIHHARTIGTPRSEISDIIYYLKPAITCRGGTAVIIQTRCSGATRSAP